MNTEPEDQTSLLRQAQEALRQSEERYRQLLALSLDAVFVHHDGIITFDTARSGQIVALPSRRATPCGRAAS